MKRRKGDWLKTGLVNIVDNVPKKQDDFRKLKKEFETSLMVVKKFESEIKIKDLIIGKMNDEIHELKSKLDRMLSETEINKIRRENEQLKNIISEKINHLIFKKNSQICILKDMVQLSNNLMVLVSRDHHIIEDPIYSSYFCLVVFVVA